jgi:glutamate-1-semialdehyde 2,1-aminomutase
MITKQWKDLAKEFDLSITTTGLAALTGFSFKSSNSLAYKTFITQEMLKAGYLAATAFYTSTSHTHEIVSGYLAALKPIFAIIKECEEGRDIMSLLEGPIAHNGFKRLN